MASPLLRLLLATACIALLRCEDIPDICALPQENVQTHSIYCSCDSELFNKAKSITCYIFGNFSASNDIWKAFERQQKIESLTFNSRPQNPLGFVPVEVLKLTTELKSLTFSTGQLGNLSSYAVSRLNHLEVIDLASNSITGISSHTFAYLPSLVKLTLSENEISKILENSFYELPELRRLFIDQNHIQAIEDLAFLHLPKLQEMDLFQNQISRITSKTFVGLKSLHRLDISRNLLTRLDKEVFMAMPQLRELDLSVNQISDISTDAFQGLSHLRSLKMNQNRLITLPLGVFIGVPDLMALDLASNKIKRLNKHVLDGLSHSRNPQFIFQLKKNPLVCSCELLWLAKFALSHETSTFITGTQYQYVKCRVEDEVLGVWTKGEQFQITALANNTLLHCPKSTTTTTTTTTVTPTTTTTTTTTPTSTTPEPPLPAVKRQHPFEKDNSKDIRPQEIEMSDAVVEDVTKSMADSKAQKTSKKQPNSSARVAFGLNMFFSAVVYFCFFVLAQ